LSQVEANRLCHIQNKAAKWRIGELEKWRNGVLEYWRNGVIGKRIQFDENGIELKIK
jgi:hypothetical protein